MNRRIRKVEQIKGIHLVTRVGYICLIHDEFQTIRAVGTTVIVDEVERLRAPVELSDGVKQDVFLSGLVKSFSIQPNDPNLVVWKVYPENKPEHWIFQWW